ncbi:helix-turn-helix domain-containing protein [Prevotella sp.]|nr:helix-turn-helix transcriptional regulator [Prevotella sp.]MBF1581224.1 helix-turn-helix transcriptional regulator [Prevotella sp.]
MKKGAKFLEVDFNDLFEFGIFKIINLFSFSLECKINLLSLQQKQNKIYCMARRSEDDKDVIDYRGKRFDMRALMVKYGVSISDLANGTGLSYGSVQSLIRLNRPSMTNMYKIAQALSCDVTELFLSEEEIENPSSFNNVDEDKSLMANDVDVRTVDTFSIHDPQQMHDAITCPYCSKRFLLLD